MKDATALWGQAICTREQAVISGNSLSDLCTKNSVSVSFFEIVIGRKRHCGVLIDVPLCEIDRQVTVDLKVVWLNKNDTILNNYLTYRMISPEKPDIVYLLAGKDVVGIQYQRYNNQNDFKQFIGTRAYSDPTKAYITPLMPYLCDSFVRILFDDSSMLQVLKIEVIGELAG
ncbi:MAG: hypothetical protein EZS28_012777 [Streblomastix strix]|uniref:Uncharacterized protein n=1 Tax=Streblomastix strix TaxID=222440 RepID=A0A5J4W9Z8_9EUKA|nr:MAG: hypothetical protein EZS28_012777 [Streblomastix strix]